MGGTNSKVELEKQLKVLNERGIFHFCEVDNKGLNFGE